MKKLLALFLALVLLVSLGACGKKEASIEELSKLPEQETTPEPEPAPEPEPEPEPEPIPEGITMETPLFTLIYDDAPGWIPDPEAETENTETYSSITLVIPDPEKPDEGTVAQFIVEVSEGSVGTYRDNLWYKGLDLRQVLEGGVYETAQAGDQTLMLCSDDPSYANLYGRDEASGMNIELYLYMNEPDPAMLGSLLAGLTFHLPDQGLTDPPYFWDGAPILTEPHTASLGDITVTSTQIPITPPVEAYDIFKADIGVQGDKAYLIADKHLYEYAFDGAAMTLTQELSQGADYERFDLTDDGTLVLSTFMMDLLLLKDGQETFSYDGTRTFVMAPDGTWGLDYFVSGDDVTKLTFADGEVTEEDLVLPLKIINYLRIDENYIYAAGTSTDESITGHHVMIFDHSGNQVLMLGGGEDFGLGCMTFMCKTANGFMGLDGNMRLMQFWSSDGTYLGGIDDKELFGTQYPWFAAAELQPDGSLIAIMTEDRPDESGTEALVFRLTGF